MKLLSMIIDHSLAVFCRHCSAKVLEPQKTNKQKFLKDRCPQCRKMGTDPIEKEERTDVIE